MTEVKAEFVWKQAPTLASTKIEVSAELLNFPISTVLIRL